MRIGRCQIPPLAAAAVAVALGWASAASAAPEGPLGHGGRWMTLPDGRAFVTHGVNMVYKRPPYHPAAAGFDAEDAAFLASLGFNTVRSGRQGVGRG